MLDPYVYEGTDVLVNKYNIRDEATFKEMEAEYTSLRIKQLVEKPISGNYDFYHFCSVHYHIFQDIFEWAGKPRTINIEKPEPVLGGISIEYAHFSSIENLATKTLSDMNKIKWNDLSVDDSAIVFSKCMSELWKNHSFRDGNTRTVVTFCCQLVETHGLRLDKTLFEKHSAYLRNALVAASSIFTDIGDLSKPEYLIEIVKNSIINM